MRALVHRVMSSKVSVHSALICSIQTGIIAYVGFSVNDTKKDAEYIGDKILTTKLFADDNGNQWQRSVVEKNYPVICLSEIALYARFKGGVPSFSDAMPLEKSPQLYQYLLRYMRKTSNKIEETYFENFLLLDSNLDNAVTIHFESPNEEVSEELAA